MRGTRAAKGKNLVTGLARRRVMLGLGAVSLALVAGIWIAWGQLKWSGETFSVAEAHQAAFEGDVLLIDIRRPDEWQRTGIGEGAIPLDMRRADFIDALETLTHGDRGTRIALICARGVRSARLSSALSEAGFDRIIDVPEGMLGSFAGPGWLRSGLPVRAYES